MKKHEAYYAGSDAYDDGAALQDNPYTAKFFRALWRRGFIDAANERIAQIHKQQVANYG